MASTRKAYRCPAGTWLGERMVTELAALLHTWLQSFRSEQGFSSDANLQLGEDDRTIVDINRGDQIVGSIPDNLAFAVCPSLSGVGNHVLIPTEKRDQFFALVRQREEVDAGIRELLEGLELLEG